MGQIQNPIDRAWRNRWRGLTILAGLFAFWMGLRSPVSSAVAKAPDSLQATRPADSIDRKSVLLAQQIAPRRILKN